VLGPLCPPFDWCVAERPKLLSKPDVHAAVITALGATSLRESIQPFRFETSSRDGAYAVSYPIRVPKPAAHTDLCVVVDIEIETGAIGIGCLDGGLAAFVDAEEVVPTGPRRKV
jgi:hypothetical protein